LGDPTGSLHLEAGDIPVGKGVHHEPLEAAGFPSTGIVPERAHHCPGISTVEGVYEGVDGIDRAWQWRFMRACDQAG
jgi:hypothetical protein